MSGLAFTAEQIADLRERFAKHVISSQDAYRNDEMTWDRLVEYQEERLKLALEQTLAALPFPVEPAPVADRQRLAEVLDPDAFDESKPRSKHHAAVVQWAARQHMAYQGADRLLAAGVFRLEAEVKAEALEEEAQRTEDLEHPGFWVARLRYRAAILRAGGPS